MNSQLSDSRLINISENQRMLSQKIVKEVLILNLVSDALKKNQEIPNIKETVSLWKSTYYA
ncbi:type IV pili methyl-accepting chemotaxis transducer N-terminal domain-containing protein [Flavobacterium frigoris]